LNPVAASTHVTFKDTLVELKAQPSIVIWVGAALDDSSSRPSEAPLESCPPSNELSVKEAADNRAKLKLAPPDATETLDASVTLQALKLVFTTLMAAARDTATPPPRTTM
jgi:hypothetical protein